MSASRVETQRYPLNWLLCWHGRAHRRLMFSVNGVVSYCAKCGRKRIGIHDFGSGSATRSDERAP